MGWIFDKNTKNWVYKEDKPAPSFLDIAAATIYGDYKYDPKIKGWRDSSGKVIGGGVKLPKERVHLNTDGTVTNLDSPALKDVRRRLKLEENSKSDPKGGWDSKALVWRAHKSPEGGKNTVAYGIKLIPDKSDIVKTKWINTYKKLGYLTDAQAGEALDDMSLDFLNRAKRTYDKRYGAGSWDLLSDKSLSILTDYQYNGVLHLFKSLMDGFHNNDLGLIYKEYERHSNKKPLTSRNASIKADLDSISDGYYNIKK